MDLFTFNSTYRVWICRGCQTGVAPRTIQGHLRSKRHRHHPTSKTDPLRAAAQADAWHLNPWDPTVTPFAPPPPESRPVPGIPVHHGYRCPEEGCLYTARTLETMRNHHRVDHGSRGRPGRPPAGQAPKQTVPVRCQRFFLTGPGSHFFTVTPEAQEKRTRQALEMSEADFVLAQVNDALLRSEGLAAAEDETAPLDRDLTEASPWLELTRWPEYVGGHSFSSVAALAALPDLTTEPLLAVVESSVGRLIGAAFESISSHRVNEFDQVRINSFLQRQGVWQRPIQIRLRPSTYRRYQQAWVRLLSFVYRTSRPDQTVELRHEFTTAQLAALDRMERHADQVRRSPPPPSGAGEGGAPTGAPRDSPSQKRKSPGASKAIEQLDRACLDLSLSLLDHELRGDIFESPVVGFLAALGIDAPNQAYRDPGSYTSHLSGLIKMSQMLLAQKAVQMADDGEVAYPGDALEEMRGRFLVYGVRAPFGWIARLRTFGKKILNTSTSLGYPNWDDSHETLHYRELTLTMDGLRRFVRTQMEIAQWDLERLFLLDEDEERGAVIPELPLHKLSDDPINNKRGWNFLQDPRNRAILPVAGERWLLDRVLTDEELRKEFTEVRQADSTVQWRERVVAVYLEWVDSFLQRLLLLIHLTGGQPARATELITLRHRNTPEGRHRNIFIEHGLVGTVTSYHKSQGVTNSTKIIHRYLPRELSELVVYYLWLILPFAETAAMLAKGASARVRSPFLWAKDKGHWDASRLGVVLAQEANTHLGTKLNVLSWRHAAIGISRMHLDCGGFKRDYGADDAIVDQQAAHGTWVAGTNYARGLKEAPGVIESRRTRFRGISREWHQFLGFEVPTGRKRRFSRGGDVGEGPPLKRAREYMTIEMSDDEGA